MVIALSGGGDMVIALSGEGDTVIALRGAMRTRGCAHVRARAGHAPRGSTG